MRAPDVEKSGHDPGQETPFRSFPVRLEGCFTGGHIFSRCRIPVINYDIEDVKKELSYFK
jgi:hypothetical protein